jgi:tetratricopeptide (TPR) repeat protein
MSSLLTKANKSRSPANRKVLAQKGKKAPTKKPQRPGKITATPKSKRTTAVKASKVSRTPKKVAAAKPQRKVAKAVKPAKKTQIKQAKKPARPAAKSAKAAVAKSSKRVSTPLKAKAAVKKSALKRTKVIKSVRASRLIPKPLPPPPKKPPTPNALAAVRAFEQALRSFHRHDYDSAKSALESVLDKFPEQPEVNAGARTYLAICEQRLSRTPSVPKNSEALYDQGVFQFNKGNTRDAIELYDRALRADPRADHVWYSLAAAYARLANSSKALDALRRAISIRSAYRSYARRDLDFANLRGNQEFRQLTGFGFELLDE